MRLEQFDPPEIRAEGNANFTIAPLLGVGPAGPPGDVENLSADDIPFAPTGTIAATNVQAAIAEVASEASGSSPASETTAGIAEIATQAETNTGTDDARFVTPLKFQTRMIAYVTGYAQPLHAALTAIAGLSPSNDDIIQRKSGSWVNRTMAQLKTDLAIAWADVSGAASALTAAITAERTAVATYTNKDLTSGTNTFPTFNQNTTGSAATLTTSRTIGTLTGDVTSAGSGFNGSANNTNATTLATVNSNVGSFGSASSVATFTVNGKGLVTAAGATSISITASQVSDFSTAADARITAAGLLTTAAAPELIRDTIGTALVEGTGIDITVDDGGDTITIAATGGGGGSYTDEQAQDAVGGILTDSAEIDLTYNDATPSITASIVAASIDESKLDASVNASLDLADSSLQPGAIGSTVQGYDADTAAIAALSPTNDDLLQRKAGAWTNRTPAQVKTDLALTKGDVGLGNVANVDQQNGSNITSGTVAEARIDSAIARLAGPALTGNPTAPTQTAGNNSTRIATTAYADGAAGTVNTALGNHLSDTTAAHAGSAIAHTPLGIIVSADNTQGAIDELESYVDSTIPTVIGHLARATNIVSGTTYTVQDSDHGGRIQFTNAGSIAVTVPNTLRTDFYCDWEQFGAGVPTFTGSSCTVRARGSANKSAGQYAVGGLSRADSDEFLLYGDITT